MKERIALVSIIINLILTIGKIAVGLIFHSTAILADGTHSLTDVFSSIISYFGIKVSQKPADKEHPYGHYQFETLAGFLITLILFATGIWIIYEAFNNLFLTPKKTLVISIALGVMIFSALVNEIMARLKIYFGKKENSLSLLSDGVHSRVDVYISLSVLAGLILTKIFSSIDSLIAFAIGFYIIKESLLLGKEISDSLLDVSAGEEVEKKIREIVKRENIILNTLKTQKKGSTINADLEISLPKKVKLEEVEEISNNLREVLMKEINNLRYVIIQTKSHAMECGFYQPRIGRGFGWQKRGKFSQDLKKTKKAGPQGECVCPRCGYKIAHQRGVPCFSFKCPNCKINLERK